MKPYPFYRLKRAYGILLSNLNSRIFHSAWLHERMPLANIIVPFHRTSRGHYQMERENYRFVRYLASCNYPISKQAYYLQKMVAEKYGWPYIKELYDDERFGYYEPTWLQLSKIRWWGHFSRIVWRTNAVLTVIVLGNMVVESDFTSLGERLSAMLSVFIGLQTFFWLLRLPARVVAILQVRASSKVQ